MEGTIGEIRMFAGNFAPRNWTFCDGQLLPINSYQAVFSIVGTTYGGDGRTTFAVPDLRGRAPIHEGQGAGLSDRRLGSRSGTEFTTLTQANLPPHTHTATGGGGSIQVSSAEADSHTPSNGNSIAAPRTSAGRGYSDTLGFNNSTPDVTLNTGSGGGSVTIGNTGSGTQFNNMQPYLTVNFILCLEGVYPSRS